MVTHRLAARDIQGLTPAIDATVSTEVFAISGKNYLFDSKGPKSIFGNRVLSAVARADPEYTQGFRLREGYNNRSFFFDRYGVWEWQDQLKQFKLIYTTPDLNVIPHRWTWGYLNGYLYLCHPAVGILAYNTEQEICYNHRELSQGTTPDNAIAVCVTNGRLCVLSHTAFHWSYPSDGLNFAPALGGGGFQVVSDRVPGDPIMISAYSGGAITWTHGGVMRSEFTADAKVFRHRVLNTEYRPVNSFCTITMDNDSVVILDQRGLFQTSGEAPVALTPVFNEFLIRYITDNNLNQGHNLRLEWDDIQRTLFVMVSSSYANPVYEKTFVLYVPMDKWGEFSEPSFGIMPLSVPSSEIADDYFGFVDQSGIVKYWDSVGSRQIAPNQTSLAAQSDLVLASFQHPTQISVNLTHRIMPSVGRLSSFSRSTYGVKTGYYLPNTMSVIDETLTGLNSHIHLGFFRAVDNLAADEMSEITGLVVRSVESGPDGVTSTDYNIVPPGTSDEDYNVVTGSEDYGFEHSNYVNHQLRVIGSIDATTEFVSAVPDLVGFAKGARYYSCSVSGIWNILEFSAQEIGESFHLKTLELTIVPAGRLL